MRAIIFDVDGTLIQSMAVDCELYVSSIKTVLGPVEFRPSFDDYDNVTDQGIIAQLIDDNALSVDANSIDLIQTLIVQSMNDHINKVGPFAEIHGATKMIDQLSRSTEIRVAVATGGWRDSALVKLESSGFKLNGIPVATSDDSPSRTEIMRIALSKLGQRFNSVTYFGDAEWDRRACLCLGWDFVAVGADLGGIESYDGFDF